MTGSRRFAVGDHVQVASIGKGVVREVRNGGRYLVDVKARQMVAVDAQLTAIETRKQREGVSPAHAGSATQDTATRSYAASSIDLHGMTTDEAIAALDTFLNEAILAGAAEVRVIHGRSGGRLKAAVHARLKVVTSIQGFHLDRTNPGVTVVTL
jgi:DNA mismatch repair protein MutS2